VSVLVDGQQVTYNQPADSKDNAAVSAVAGVGASKVSILM